MDHKKLRTYITAIIELTDEDFTLLLKGAHRRTLKKGECVLDEGESCRAFYLVEEGYLRTYYNKDGVAINLNFTFEGSIATNIKSVKTRQPSNLVIEAGEPAVVWILNLDILSGETGKRPLLKTLIRRVAVRLLLESEEHNSMFKIYSPAERYHYIEQNKPELLQRVSLSQIASYLGVSRETLSRIRGKAIG